MSHSSLLQSFHTMKLSSKVLSSLPPSVAVPRYDRSAVTAGIVHFGANEKTAVVTLSGMLMPPMYQVLELSIDPIRQCILTS
jgi:hypothetical protein